MREPVHGDRGGSAGDRLARLFEGGQLARVVPGLSPETLHQLIRRRGLDASGEILAAMAPEQLASVLDLDLWPSPDPAGDERFDHHRFAEWLEALVETGDATAARVVAGIDRRVVTAGLARYIRVFDLAARAQGRGSEDRSPEDDALSDASTDVGGYLVVARSTRAWDAIVAVLLALLADHSDYFHAVMRGCRRLSDSTRESDGLDDLLTAPQQLLHDVALDREHHRSRQGYLSPADARAFLDMARQPPLAAQEPGLPRGDARPGGRSSYVNPIAACYLTEERAGGAGVAPVEHRDAFAPGDSAVGDLLAEAGLLPERPRGLLPGAPGDAPRMTQIRRLMEHLRDSGEPAYLLRTRELAFLSNALMAGCSVQSRPFTVQEAFEAAAAACNLGLECWPPPGVDAGTGGRATSGPGTALPDTFLADQDLITVFAAGWAVLHQASLSVADRLLAILKDLQCADMETQLGLNVLRRDLARQRESGTPWRAIGALDVMATLDVAAWAALMGLLGECPVLPAAMRAAVERRTGPVSATAFEFIASRRQVGDVQTFLSKLPDILLG